MRQILSILLLCCFWQLHGSEREITWCGQQWLVKSGKQRGPGPNNWSDSKRSVWLDQQQRLHLKLRKENGLWLCPEVYTKKACGYGRYHFELASDVQQLDKHVVLGLFAYADDQREVDIEISSWSKDEPPKRQFVVQPYHRPGHLFKQPLMQSTAGAGMHYEFIWSRSGIVCADSYQGQKRSWLFKQQPIPDATKARMHVNLWLFRGQAPSNKKEYEVIISRAIFEPLKQQAPDK